ncbi:MAG: MarR family winged helix-turn-helix transcriptional regulator [Lutisporaceae bacterium]
MEVAEFKKIVWCYTRKIGESMNSVVSPISEKYGLTMMQTRILMELHQYESHTIGSLADSICVAGANISAMCKKLEGQGLLERVRNRADERVVRVVLTSLGKETVLEIDRLYDDKISQYFINENEDTFDDIILGLQKLNDILQKISNVENK